MNNISKFAPWCWIALLASLLLYIALQLPQRQWDSSITSLLPTAEQAWQQPLLAQINSSHQITLKLSGLPITQLRDAATALQQSLPNITWHQPGEILNTLQQQYQQHQSLVISPNALDLLRQQQYQKLIDAAWQRLYSPAPLLANALKQDPLLLTQQFIEQQGTPNFTIKSHWLETKDQSAILLHAEADVDPFDRLPASKLLHTLETQLTAITTTWPQLQIARSGVLFHAVNAADNANVEMQFYGGLSLAAILALLWFSFRSLRPLWLTSLILVPAIITGFSALLLAFSTPHVLSMVFATTLIGIAVDYSFHGMLAANQSQIIFKRMLPSLALSLLTTLLGYLVLLLLPFALLQQVALFMLAGLSAAFISVWLLFPVFLQPQTMRNNPWLQQRCLVISNSYQRIKTNIIWAVGTTLAIALGLLLMFKTQFSDDVRLFNQSPVSLMQQEADIRHTGGQLWDSRFIVVLTKDAEHSLQTELALHEHLANWQQQGWFMRWQGVTQQLPSQQLQHETQQLLQHAYSQPELQAYLGQLNISAPTLREDRLTPATFSSPLTQHLITLQDYTAAIILLQQVTEPTLLQQALEQLPNVYLLDPISDTNHSLQHLRHQLLGWLALALLLSMAALSWQRGIKAAIATGLILVIATASALAISLLLQKNLNVFNLVAAILVLALALDYAVFFTSPLQKIEVYQAVLLSACTSCLAFGMLGFSHTPAIASFGITVFTGVGLAALLAPLLAVICKKESDSHGTL